MAELDAVHVPGRAVGALGELVRLVAELRAAPLDERLGHDLGATVDQDGDVLRLGVEDHGVVGGKGPRRGRPDVDPEAVLPGLEAGGDRGHLEAHEDGGAHLVAVLDLGLGEGGVAVTAPVHGLAAAVDGAAVEDGLEDLDVGGVVVVDVGEVGIVPLGEDAEAPEALALGVNLLDGHLAAELADLLGGKLVELLGAEHLLDLVLDGLAVAVPAGDVRRLVALHGPVAVDDVLGDLVLGVAQVDGAVGVRGAVMEDELLVPLVLLEHELVDARVLPRREPLGLVLRQARSHRELGLGQVRGLLVLVCHLAIPSPQTDAHKKTPVPPAGTKRSNAHFACDHPASGTPPYSVDRCRRSAGDAYSRPRALGPQLRGDFRRDVDAGSQHPRSLSTTLSRVLSPSQP